MGALQPAALLQSHPCSSCSSFSRAPPTEHEGLWRPSLRRPGGPDQRPVDDASASGEHRRRQHAEEREADQQVRRLRQTDARRSLPQRRPGIERFDAGHPDRHLRLPVERRRQTLQLFGQADRKRREDHRFHAGQAHGRLDRHQTLVLQAGPPPGGQQSLLLEPSSANQINKTSKKKFNKSKMNGNRGPSFSCTTPSTSTFSSSYTSSSFSSTCCIMEPYATRINF